MTKDEAMRIAIGLRTDFKCESDTMVDFCNTVIKALEKEPCEDVISRQKACDAVRKYKIGAFGSDAYDKAFDDGIDTAIAEIGHNVPSVTPVAKNATTTEDCVSRQAAIAVADYVDYTGLAIEDVKMVTDEIIK